MNTGSVDRLRSVGIISPTNDTNAVYDITKPKIPFLMQPMVYDVIKKDEGLFNKLKILKMLILALIILMKIIFIRERKLAKIDLNSSDHKTISDKSFYKAIRKDKLRYNDFLEV